MKSENGPQTFKGGRVTLVIRVYNSERYLMPCLESALAQTYGNIEILAVNDGSGGLSGLNLYVDGRNDSFRWAGTPLTGSVANGHPIAIGHAGTQTGDAPDALLDDIRVYPMELPAGYISAVHECHREVAADLAGGRPQACMRAPGTATAARSLCISSSRATCTTRRATGAAARHTETCGMCRGRR